MGAVIRGFEKCSPFAMLAYTPPPFPIRPDYKWPLHMQERRLVTLLVPKTRRALSLLQEKLGAQELLPLVLVLVPLLLLLLLQPPRLHQRRRLSKSRTTIAMDLRIHQRP